MLITVDKKSVEVYDSLCPSRSCFQLGADKGNYVQGRGYVSYHKEPKWVCWRRHMHGCPSVGVCGQCRRSLLEKQTVCFCGAEVPPPYYPQYDDDDH